jgi:hypothetical protein
METRVSQPSPTLIERRRQYFQSALGSLRIEGLELDATARALADQYVDGQISGDELTAALLALP